MAAERRKGERRKNERRQSDRRKVKRGTPERRQGERRQENRRKSLRRDTMGMVSLFPMSAMIRHRFLTANGIRMHLAEAGPEPPAGARLPVLLLHGFPELWYSWRHQLESLGDTFLCAAPDLRGYGQTEITRAGYDTFTLAADVAALMDQLGGRVNLVGHDWGGIVAWHAALQYPEKVARFVAIAAPHPIRYWEVLWSNWRQFKMSQYVLGFQIPWLPEWQMSRNRGEFLARTLRQSAVRPGTFKDEDIEVYRQAWSNRASMRAGVNYYRAAVRRQRELQKFYRGRKVQCPGLVIWGDKDFALSLKLTEKLERFFVDPPRIEILQNCGHWVQQEAPEECNRLLREFLSENQ